MDQRLYFIFADIFTTAVTGAVVGLVSAALVGPGWPMLAAMVALMVVGMIVGTLLFFPLSIFFGAMEVMVPCMLAGMISGMVVSMWASMQSLNLFAGAMLGIQSALCALIFIWVANTMLRGKRISNRQ